MGYSFNGTTRRITLTSGTTAFSINDLYSRWKDWVLANNAGFSRAFGIIGGEAIGGGLQAGAYLFLDNGWSIIPDNVNHTLTVEGNLVRSPEDLSGVPLFQQVGANVLIVQQASAVAIGYSTGGGTTLTPTQIWTHSNRTLTAGKFEEADRTALEAAKQAAEATAKGGFANNFPAAEATQYDAEGNPLQVFELLDADGNPAQSPLTAVERRPKP